MHTHRRRTRRLRAWVGLIGGILITGLYIGKARLAGYRLEGEEHAIAAGSLPGHWSRWGRWWLEFTLRTEVNLYGMTDELRRKLRTKSVFVLGNHFSVIEMLWSIDFFSNFIGHVMRLVCKWELGETLLGKGMKAIRIGWFINRENGKGAVESIRTGIREALELFQHFTAIVFTDGTKPTAKNIAHGRDWLHQQAVERDDPFGRLCIQLISQFTTTRVPAAGGAAAEIEAARQCENSMAIYVSIRSPRHVAAPLPPLQVIAESRFLSWLQHYKQEWALEIAKTWAFILDIVDQAEALIDESIDIWVEELDIETEAHITAVIGMPAPLNMQDLRIVPTTHDRDRFHAWVLLRGARTDGWIAEVSGSVRLGADELTPGVAGRRGSTRH